MNQIAALLAGLTCGICGAWLDKIHFAGGLEPIRKLKFLRIERSRNAGFMQTCPSTARLQRARSPSAQDEDNFRIDT
jgi:hypothetical protein